MILDKNTGILEEEMALPGVRRVAEWLKKDMELVFGQKPAGCTKEDGVCSLILYGTVGRSALLEELELQGKIDLSPIKSKWETYSFQIVEGVFNKNDNTVIIAGSDKRGTIYGLLHLSELLGVSPLVNWNHVWPQKKDAVELTEKDNKISKEPSVKYRGFFINDEWPAFGNWAKIHFGGINAKCYERIFELLLRLKGNYLWPAMWDSNFELDGPGIASAELADELGVVMSMSHHEPCMRSGGEYSLMRGKDSIYGDAWDFISNKEGITRFWRDGLLRTNHFEQVITMGMRGENDTAIMANATLADNIQLVKNVIKTQNELIRETICENLSQVPRQIVLFTEVEEFFYGNEETPGLISDPELDGVTLMLSDNNAGYTRTLPKESMRYHKGGYGMYYHMDMHGGPHSFQWIGSTYLPVVQDQMTTAYEYGVQEIWVTNVGDVGTQEFGLSYFLDLAYDVETYGCHGEVSTEQYTKDWVQKQFASLFGREDLTKAVSVVQGYLDLLKIRKHEALNDRVFHPVHFGESTEILDLANRILETAEQLKAKCPEEGMGSFISLLYYPACGTANLFKLWILSGRNQYYAKQGRLEANDLAEEIPVLLKKDEEYVQEYMSVDEGYFDGFGLSEHIGFTFWNDEDNRYPVSTFVNPVKANRMVVVRCDHSDYLTGGFWKEMSPRYWEDALRPDVDSIDFEIAAAGTGAVKYRIQTDCEWLAFSKTEGFVEKKEVLQVKIDRAKFQGEAEGLFTVENEAGDKAKIMVRAYQPLETDVRNAYWESDGYVSIQADHFSEKKDVPGGAFEILAPYGREKSAIRVYPVTADFEGTKDCPYVEYHIAVKEEGDYKVIFYLAPSTPVIFESKQYLGYAANGEEMKVLNTVRDPKRPFFLSAQWSEEAISHIKMAEGEIHLQKGFNTIRFYGISPQIILEKLVICRMDSYLPESCLGPKESYFHKAQ